MTFQFHVLALVALQSASALVLCSCNTDISPPLANSPHDPGSSLMTQEKWSRFSGYIEGSRSGLNVPGVAVAVVHGGQVVFAQGFGVKELGGDESVDEDTLFGIGSLGKALTTTLVAGLVDDGIVQWDTPIADWLPNFQPQGAEASIPISLKHAFAMTSGFEGLGPILMFSGLAPEGYTEFLSQVSPVAPAGEAYAYQNEVFALAGYAATLAAVGGSPHNLPLAYRELMQERVLAPLDMSTATFSVQQAQASANHATPHYARLTPTLAETGFDVASTDYWDIEALEPAGTLNASANDMAQYLMAMLSEGQAEDGTVLASPERLAETWETAISRPPAPFQQAQGAAMGWTTVNYQGVELLAKDGNTGGFSAQMGFAPAEDIGIVVLSNVDLVGTLLSRDIQYRLLELALNLEPLIEAHSASELEELSSLGALTTQLTAVSPDQVNPYLGSYEVGVGTPYELVLDSGRLWVHMGELDYLELLAAPDGSYVAVSGGEFVAMPFELTGAETDNPVMTIAGQMTLPHVH